jgi:hypothetical protein
MQDFVHNSLPCLYNEILENSAYTCRDFMENHDSIPSGHRFSVLLALEGPRSRLVSQKDCSDEVAHTSEAT